MGKKASKKKGAQPVVSAEALKKAQEILADEAEKKRQRSSMAYRLGQTGENVVYDNLGNREKNKFLEEHVARLIEEGKVKVKHTTNQTVALETSGVKEGEWLCKTALIQRYGAEKAQNKIDSGKLRVQPDPDTGLDGEWDKEYYVSKVKKVETETDRQTLDIKTDEDLTEGGSRIKDVLETFRDVKSCVAMNGEAASGSAAGSTDPPTPLPPVEIKTEESKNTKTVEALKKDVRKVFLSCSEAITILKTYFRDTESGRYTQELNSDLKKLIPKFSKIFKKLEQATISKITDPGTLLALATELDQCYSSFNEVEDWYYRLVPDAEKKVGKKRKRTP